MAGSGPHQTSLHQVEFANVHQQDEFLNLERERDRENYQEGSVIPPTRVEVVFEGKVTYPMSKVMIKPCNERLMT